MTTQIATNRCEGYNCTPPKECCRQGCCFFVTPPLYHPTPIQTNHLLTSPLFLGHWYFWLAVTATVAGILCACSLWKKHSQDGGCCRSGSSDSRRRCSEPESNGSCYAPPQYSRCNSFHQPPPPYSEVASKPDMYPLVIAYHNPEPVVKSNNSTGFLMMQYFRNFIVRPVGNLSTTSTNDSLSSSFLCSAANEANLIIPPAYSNIASLEDLVSDPQPQPSPSGSDRRIPRSASSISSATTEYHQVLQHSPSAHTQLGIPTTPLSCHSGGSLSVGRLNTPSRSSQQSLVQIRDNPCFAVTQGTTNRVISAAATAKVVTKNDVTTSHSVSFSENIKNEKLQQKPLQLSTNPLEQHVTCPALPPPTRKSIYTRSPKEKSQDSTEDDDTQHNNFSDLLNLSLCQPQSEHPQVHSATAHLQDLHFSVTTSMTGSDISSLANLGTPDSPPRATSPTVEMRELLDKIQQLPQQKSPVPPAGVHSGTSQARNYFHKMRAKTLYMPLIEPEQEGGHAKIRVVPNVFSRVWLSRSAPTTPCGNFTPTFPIIKGSKSRITDGSPLLKNHVEESEDEPNKEGILNKEDELLNKEEGLL